LSLVIIIEIMLFYLNMIGKMYIPSRDDNDLIMYN